MNYSEKTHKYVLKYVKKKKKWKKNMLKVKAGPHTESP